MKALYVDFDGTLATDRYWRSVDSVIHNQIQDLLFRENTIMVGDWMRGRYSAEEVNKFITDKLELSYDELWQTFVEDCANIYVEPDLLKQIGSLRKSYTTVLMTGNMDSFTRFTVPALELENYFDYISNSFYEGMHKTDYEGELFAKWSDKLGIPFTDSILIDDNNNCCQIFEALGGQAHQTKSPSDTLEIISNL